MPSISNAISLIIALFVIFIVFLVVSPLFANSPSINTTLNNPNLPNDNGLKIFWDILTLMGIMLIVMAILAIIYVLSGVDQHNTAYHTEQNTILYNNSKQPEINTNQENNDGFVTGYGRL